MTGHSDPQNRKTTAKPAGTGRGEATPAREDRLKAALKANMARRKAQARARAAEQVAEQAAEQAAGDDDMSDNNKE